MASLTRRRPAVAGPLGGTLGVLALLLLALALREIASLIVPLLFGAFLALVAWPLVDVLRRRGLPNGMALGLTIAIVVLAVIGSAGIIALSIGELVILVPRYEAELGSVLGSIQALLAQFGLAFDPQAYLSVVSPEQIATLVRQIASALSGGGLAVLVILLTMSYALVGGESLRLRATSALGGDHPLLLGVQRFGNDLRRYLVVRAVLGVFAAVLVVVLLLALGVPLPLLWGFLVFAASFIPNIGVILAVIPPTVLAALDGGLGTAAAVLVGYVVINFAQDNLLQPVIVSTNLNLTPLVVFVGVVVWAWILGAAGALLAVPLTVAVVAVLEASPSSRPLAELMRQRIDEPPGLRPEPREPHAG